MDAQQMATGWHYTKAGVPGSGPVGPLTWEQLYSATQRGEVGPADMVWHASLPQWMPAAQVQGLFPAPMAGAPQAAPGAQWPGYPPAGAYVPYGGPPPGHTPAPRRSPLVWIVPTVLIVLAGLGLGLGLGLTRGGDDGQATTDSTQTPIIRTTTTTVPRGPSAWTELPGGDLLPPGRDSHGMIYDPVSQRLIVFGGYGFDTYLDDTWAYDTATGAWAALDPPGGSPDPRNGHAMVYDPALGKVVLCGGYNDESDLSDVWSFGP